MEIKSTYIWTNVLNDHTPGLVVVMAFSDQEAMDLLDTEDIHHRGLMISGEMPTIHNPNAPGAGIVEYVYGGS